MAIINTPSLNTQNNLLRSERIAGGIFPKILTTFDLIVILVTIILWIPNAAIVAGAGVVAYIYWGLGFLTFLLPGAIVTAHLGLMFPGEGSLYIWTTKALGDFMGFLAGFCTWWPGILAMIAAADTVVSLIQQLGMLFHIQLLPDPGMQGLVIIAVLVLSFILSMLRFRFLQNLINSVFVVYTGTIFMIGVAGIIWLVSGHQANIDLSFPGRGWSLNSSNFTFYGTVVLALLGIEVPLNMGVEIRDTHSIKRYLFWGSMVIIISYLVATFGVMIVVPLGDQGNPTGITEALQRGFGPVGSWIAALADFVLLGFFLAITTVFNFSYGRLLFVAGLDRRLPAIISKVSTNKIPWVAILVQTIIAIALTAIIFVLAPLSLKSAHLTTLMYAILEASVTVIWCISMVLLFFDILVLRRKYSHLFASIRMVPDWLLSLCSICGSLASIVAIAVIFTAPWSNTTEGGFLTTIQWDMWIASIAVVSVFVALFGFVLGKESKKSTCSDEEIIKEVTG